MFVSTYKVYHVKLISKQVSYQNNSFHFRKKKLHARQLLFLVPFLFKSSDQISCTCFTSNTTLSTITSNFFKTMTSSALTKCLLFLRNSSMKSYLQFMHGYDITTQNARDIKNPYDVISTQETISNHYGAKEVLSRVTVFEMLQFSPDLSIWYNTIPDSLL